MDLDAAIEHHLSVLVPQLQAEGILDDQFSQLLMLQDEANPDFVSEVVELYFNDSVGKIERIAAMLGTGTPDFNELDQIVHQFKGSSASLGATRIAQLCIQMRERCLEQNRAGCQALLAQIQEAYQVLWQRLQYFMQLEAQRKATRGPGS